MLYTKSYVDDKIKQERDRIIGIIKKHAKNGYWGTEIDKVLKEIEGKK